MIDPIKMAEKTAALALATAAPGTAETMRMVAAHLRSIQAGRDGLIQAVAMGTINPPHATMGRFLAAWDARSASDDVWTGFDRMGN